MHDFVYNLVSLLVIVDPLGTAVMFVALAAHIAPAHRRSTAWRGAAIAAALLLLFAFVGRALLDILGISLPAFQIAGGLLLFLVATDMVLALRSGIRSTTRPEEEEAAHSRNIAVFPLAIPLIAGPGALTSITLLMRGAPNVASQAWVLLALAVTMALTLVALLAATVVARFLGVTGANVVTRVLGIVLAALAAQYVINGVRATLAG
jgi:multiple antibiotic resistance protein